MCVSTTDSKRQAVLIFVIGFAVGLGIFCTGLGNKHWADLKDANYLPQGIDEIYLGMQYACVKSTGIPEVCVDIKDVDCKDIRQRFRLIKAVGVIHAALNAFLFFTAIYHWGGGKTCNVPIAAITGITMSGIGLIGWAAFAGTYEKGFCGGTSLKAQHFKIGWSFALYFVGWAVSFFTMIGYVAFIAANSKGGDAAPANAPNSEPAAAKTGV